MFAFLHEHKQLERILLVNKLFIFKKAIVDSYDLYKYIF